MATSFPINTKLESPTSLLTVLGGVKSSVGSILTSYASTAAADSNAYISSYAGAMIVTSADGLYFRNQAASAWIQVLTTQNAVPISSLTAAIAVNQINNGDYGQEWRWNSLSTGYGLLLSSTSTAANADPIMLGIDLSGNNLSSARTTYGMYISNAHGGGSSTAVALYLSATVANTKYALLVPPSSGNVGIGNATPSQLLSLGTAGIQSGIFTVGGSTSGTITFQPQAAAGTYNWNWPTTAGTAGQVLTSQGGAGTAMTWTTPSTASGTVTSVSVVSANGFAGTVATATTTPAITLTTTVTTNQVLFASSNAITGSGQFTFTGQAIQTASTNTTQSSTSSAFVGSYNSLTTGTGMYLSSSSLSTGSLLNLSITGTAANTSQTGILVGLSGANSNSSAQSYCISVQNFHSGTGSLNVGYSAVVQGGDSNYGFTCTANGFGTTNYGGFLSGAGAGGANNYGVYAQALGGTGTNYGGFITTYGSTAATTYGIFVLNSASNSTLNCGAYVQVSGSTSGTNYGLYVSVSGATSNYAILIASGTVGIGTTSPVASALLEMTSGTQGFLPPRMGTGGKNAISSPATGLVIYDSTLNKLCVYTGAAWETVTSI